MTPASYKLIEPVFRVGSRTVLVFLPVFFFVLCSMRVSTIDPAALRL